MKSQAGLNRLRGEIDRIDDAILDLIEKRIALSSEIAAAKACAADELLIRR
jgi:chorismate mutase